MSLLTAEARTLLVAQFGLISRRQLLDLGFTRGQVEGLVRRGTLEKVHCGTYRLAGGGVPSEQRALAAVLRCRPDARLTGPVALALLGVEGFTLDDPLEVLVPAGRCVQNVSFTVRPDPLFDVYAATFGPVPIATATRAFADTAMTIKGKRLRTGWDNAKYRGLVNASRQRRCCETLGAGHAGAAHLLDLFDAGVFDHDSDGERALAELFADFQPPPEPNVWITPTIRVDFLFRPESVVVEYDGEVAHGGGEARAEDAQRDAALEARGYLVDHVTKGDVQNADRTRQRVREILRRRQSLALR